MRPWSQLECFGAQRDSTQNLCDTPKDLLFPVCFKCFSGGWGHCSPSGIYWIVSNVTKFSY